MKSGSVRHFLKKEKKKKSAGEKWAPPKDTANGDWSTNTMHPSSSLNKAKILDPCYTIWLYAAKQGTIIAESII